MHNSKKNSNFAEKNRFMFYANTKEIDKEQIMFVPFENAPQTVKIFILHKLRCVVNHGENAFALYNVKENEPLPLGYCCVDNLNITNSKYIKALFKNTAIYTGQVIDADVYNQISKQVCIHISQWQFDKKLQDIEILKRIFSHLMSHIRSIGKYELIWYDGNENIVYYPVQDIDYYFNYISAAAYFAQAFFYKQ